MDLNPRKVERAAYLYDYKLAVRQHAGRDTRNAGGNLYASAAKSTVIELLWPALATAMRESDEVSEAVDSLLGNHFDPGLWRTALIESNQHLPIVGQLAGDARFLHVMSEFPKHSAPET